jgi:flagellar biosynthesis/type III secretory pathway protein FliH
MPPFALEDFDSRKAPAAAPRLTVEEVEEVRRAAYENGFQAGAMDAVAAQQAEDARLSAELVTTLKDLSFGFHEASAHVMSNVAPVLRAVVDTVLPDLMSEIVGHTILETVEPLVEEAASIPVRLLVSPGEAPAIRQIIGEAADIPFVIVEDPALERGRAHVKIGAAERHIDVSGVLDRISAAVDAVTDLNTRKTAYG